MQGRQGSESLGVKAVKAGVATFKARPVGRLLAVRLLAIAS